MLLFCIILFNFFTQWLDALVYKFLVYIRVKLSVLQCEMDRELEGKDFKLPIKLGQHLAITFTIFSFSIAIPDLVGFLPIYFFLFYWLDKWEVFRVCRVPPRYDPSLNDRANQILGFIIVF